MFDMQKRVKRNYFIIFIVCVLVFLVIVNHNASSWRREKLKNLKKSRDSQIHCLFRDFTSLIKSVDSKLTCVDNHLLEFEVQKGSLIIPDSFAKKVKDWLGNDEKLFENVLNQSILNVYNRFTGITTVYNPLRSSRPLSKNKIDPKMFVENYLNKTQENCDFCKYENNTAYDIFGRLESNLAATAANSFKVEGFHSLVFPKRHSTLDLSYEEFLDVFQLSNQWFKLVHKKSPKHTHPQMIYDSLEHAGASQPHPHFHLFMGKNHYLGKYRSLSNGQKNYRKEFDRDYFQDYVNSHFNIGLGVKLGTASIIVPLDSYKDNEFVIIADELNEDWIRSFYLVLRTFIEELEVFCWSSGIAFPSFKENDDLNLPAIIRIGSRGNCQSMTNDASSFELYAMFNVNTNPYQTIKALRNMISRENI